MGFIRSFGLGINERVQLGALLKPAVILSATVEDSAPSNVVLTFDKPATLTTGDINILGSGISATVNSLSWTGNVCTVALSTPVIYGDVFSLVIKGVNQEITNNIIYANFLKRLFGSHIIGLWTLTQTSGISVADVSGNNCTGTISGTVGYNASTAFGLPSINFGGIGGLGIYSSTLASKFNFNAGYASVWIKANNLAAYAETEKPIFLFGQQDNRWQHMGLTISNNKIENYWETYHNAISKFNNVSGFYNVGVRWNKTNNTMNMYLNGIAQSDTLTNLPTVTAALGSWINFFGWDSYTYPKLSGSHAILLDYAPTDADILKSVNPEGVIASEGDSRSKPNTSWLNIAVNSVISNHNEFAIGKKSIYAPALGGENIASLVNRANITDSKLIPNKTNTLIVWIGVNDSYYWENTLFDLIKSYCLARRAAGWSKIIMCTEIDAQDAARNTWSWHTKYIALNALIKSDNSFYDTVADLGARAELQDATNTTYFTDKVHLTDAGNAVVAEVVGAALATLGL